MSRSRAPFTHAVWWRYQRKDGTPLTAWHDQPRMYRSEKSATRGAADLNTYYTTEESGNFMFHLPLPIGVHPYFAFKDEA